MLVVGSEILKRASVILDDLIRVKCRSHDGFRGLCRASKSRWEYRDRGNGRDATAFKEKEPSLLAKVPHTIDSIVSRNQQDLSIGFACNTTIARRFALFKSLLARTELKHKSPQCP